jgi:hypothetical protein
MIGPAGRWVPPGRWLVPLLLALFALLTAGTKYVMCVRQLDAEVTEAETRRLRERLTVEQSRLNLQADPSSLSFVRGVIGGMGLYKGMRAAFLLQPGGRVQASLTRPGAPSSPTSTRCPVARWTRWPSRRATAPAATNSWARCP